MTDYAGRMDTLCSMGQLRTLKLYTDAKALDFSSNDYLDLACHPFLSEASARATCHHGCGTSASRLMSGNRSFHLQLERELAELVGMDSALLFGSGFLANIGLLSSITDRDDVILADRLCHASIVDGSRLSRARFLRYRHCDMDHLEQLLAESSCVGTKYIVTDSLFSMDGDIAPIEDLHDISGRHGCRLIVDEAHAVGVFGGGSGICAELGIRPHAIVGTLSKALGSYGGFVACGSELRDYLINTSRSFIYSTGLPPACSAAASASLTLLRGMDRAGEILQSRAGWLREELNRYGFDTGGSRSQIVPVITGSNIDTLRLSTKLLNKGIVCVAIRPPTVPAGSSRLRLSVTLRHSMADLELVAGELRRTITCS